MTPGYWLQDQHFGSWVQTGYAPSDDLEVVFGVDASFSPHTLLDAGWLAGGGENALARHAVAALTACVAQGSVRCQGSRVVYERNMRTNSPTPTSVNTSIGD